MLQIVCIRGITHAQDPLPSWNEGPAKQAILQFVRDTTAESGPKFVPPHERIATFDNDGTLWCEHADLHTVCVHDRPREGARAAASGLEGQAAVQGGAGE